MTAEPKCTRSVEAELQVQNGRLVLRFCDAQVAQWDESFDLLEDWTEDADLEAEIASEIENVAAELARSLVRDLRERVLTNHNEQEWTNG